VTGLAIALDSPPDTISVSEANLMLAGTACGASLLLIAIAETATRMTRPWQRIGLRVLASWIAASATLVLALRLLR
jgi:urease accessory protein